MKVVNLNNVIQITKIQMVQPLSYIALYQNLTQPNYLKSMFEEDSEVIEFNITIKQIKLAVKFPCKLTLNYQNKVIKADVSVNEIGKYIIERQVKAKSQNTEPIEILIHLTTEKGGNIMAGIIKLNPKDSSLSEGQTLTVGLQKCLDQNANCLLRIDRVWITRNSKAKSMVGQGASRNRKSYGEDFLGTKKVAPTVVDNYRNAETRSEFPGFNLKKPSGLRKQGGFEGINHSNKLYGLGPKSYVPQIQISKSKNLDRSTDFRKQGNKYRIDDDNKTVGKREVDPSYRLTIESNEKNLKMDIMKYKMKAQEHEKTLEQKNKQIKQLKEQISQLHRQSVEKSFYQQEINSKNHTIQKLQDTTKQLNKDNSRFETRIIELQRALQETKSNLASGLQRAKDEKERREMELGKQLTLKKDEVTLLNDELRAKNNQVSRIKKIIEDLQKSLQSKTFDYEKAIQSERAQMAKLEVLLNDKIKQLQEMNKSTTNQKDNLQSQLRKKTEHLLKLETNTNHLMSEIKEISELQKYYATYKTKFSDLEKVYEKLQEQKKEVEKHYLKLMETKQKDYGEFKQEQSGLLTSYKKKNTELTEKTKHQATRILELENKTALLGSEMDKLRRSLDLAQKQLSHLTENCKSLNQSLKQKDDQLLSKQKELSELESKLSTRESLMKKDIEYKTQQLAKVSTRLTQQQHLYRQQKENNETLRFQATKIEGKTKLQEEINSRLNRQLEEFKILTDKRETQYKEELKQMNEKLKLYEQMEKKFNKQITECEMLDLNRKNDINRLNKELEIKNQKIDRLAKRNHQHQLLIKQLNELNSKSQQQIASTERQLKDLQNNKKALQADFTKTEKIKTIIVEEKTTAQNELHNLKRDIESRITKEQSLNKEIKDLKEELTKITLKANNQSKDFQTFKENLYTTIEGAFYSSNGNSVNKSFNFAIDNNAKDSPTRSHRRNTSSLSNANESLSMKNGHKRLSQSEVINSSQQRSFIYEPRFNEIIESYGRQSQQAIMVLNDSVRKYKTEIQRLERQSATLSSRLQSTEQQSANVITSLERQLQSLGAKGQQFKTQWEQKFMLSQRASRQKDQVIEELNDELEQIHHQLAANSRTNQIQFQQLALKIEQLKAKNYDLEARNDFSSMTILGYEEKIFALQSTISQLSQQIEFEKQKVQRKDKLIIEHTSRIEQLSKMVEQAKKQRLELSHQLTSMIDKLQIERQNSQKHKKLLLQQEEKNKEIKGFNHNLLKEKESIVKNQLIKSQKVIQLQDIISRLKMEKDEVIAQNEVKEKIITQIRAQIKRNMTKIKQDQEILEKSQNEARKLIETIKEKQKKIQQKQLEIKNLEINLQKIMTKYDQEIKKFNHEQEQNTSKFNKELQEKKTKILELTNEMQKLSHLEKKLSEQNISLEEQIFFEKQTNSLASSRFDLMNRDIDDVQSKLNQAIREIEILNEQVRDREEKMFELSNKLYGQDSKLQMKEIEMRDKLQKLDFDWKNKFEETLQDYEAKIESYEREKHYLRSKLQQEMQQISKLQNEKRTLMMEEQTGKKIFEEKIKKVQNQRLGLLVEKNKEIERLKLQIETLEDRIKQIKHEKDIKDDDIRRLEEKIREKDDRLLSQEEKAQHAVAHLEKELEFQKKKQSQLKKYKEFIKNNLWSSEREIKRILQSYIKNIMVLCEEEKKKDLIDIMKTVEGQIVKAIEFNLEEV